MPAGSGRYPSGQRGQTVNLLAYAFGGSNPPLPTTFDIAAARGARRRGTSGNSSAVERQPSKLGVAGSNPVSRSMLGELLDGAGLGPAVRGAHEESMVTTTNGRAHVAQLAEHALGKGEVSGSIPDMGSIVERAAGRREAGAPPSEARMRRVERTAGRREIRNPAAPMSTRGTRVIASVDGRS
jgi:hypothetical protein